MSSPKRLVAVAIAGVGLAFSGFGVAASFTVTLTPSGPDPARVTVALGDTVTFVNATPEPRTLTSSQERLSTDAISPGGSHEYTATVPGTIRYSFGTARTQRGSVVVQRVGSISLAARTKTVTFGQKLRVFGRATPAAFPVSIEERSRGSEDWVKVAEATSTASRGAFSVMLTPRIGGHYRASLFGGAIRSPRISVGVRPNVLVRATARTARSGSTVALRVRTRPVDAAPRVTLLAYNARRKAWTKVSTHRLVKGVAVVRWRVEKGRTRLRVSISRRDAKPGFEGATSKFVVVMGV